MFDFIKKYFPKEHSSKVEVAQNKELPKAKSNLGSVEPKKATSINKTVLFTVSGIFIIIFVYSFLAAIEKPPEKEKTPQSTVNTNNSENNPFQTLPGSYDEKQKKPKAGNTQDNKSEVVSNKQKLNTNINNFPRPPALPRNYAFNNLEEQRRKLEEKEFEDARKSKIGIFTLIANATSAQAKTIANAANNNLEEDSEQNQQSTKENFIKNSSLPKSFNPHVIQKSFSSFEIKAGNIIPAALISGINTDLPGEIIAQVTENVFDSSTGEYLLIPQGSKLIGKYDSKVVFNQFRVLLVWQRIIFPNGKSIYLNNLQGMDTEGYSGLRDQVDRHTPDLIKGIVLSTIFGAGAAIVSGNDSDDDSYKAKAGRGAGEAILDVGNEITRKNLNRQPTLKIRPGHTFTIMVNQDLILEAYDEQ